MIKIFRLNRHDARKSHELRDSMFVSFNRVGPIPHRLQALGGEEPAHVTNHATSTYEPGCKGKNDQDSLNERRGLKSRRCTNPRSRKG